MYPIDQWCLHERLRQELPRTNNAAEGYHSTNMKITGGKMHAPLYQSIAFLHKIEANAMKNQADWETGACAYKRPKYLTITTRLNKMLIYITIKMNPKLLLLNSYVYGLW